MRNGDSCRRYKTLDDSFLHFGKLQRVDSAFPAEGSQGLAIQFTSIIKHAKSLQRVGKDRQFSNALANALRENDVVVASAGVKAYRETVE